MFILLAILSQGAYMGEYDSLNSCKNAIYEIYATRANPPGQRLKELEQAIQTQISLKKEFICVSKSK